MPGAHKIGAAISGPRIAGGIFMDITLFLKKINFSDRIFLGHHGHTHKHVGLSLTTALGRPGQKLHARRLFLLF